MNAKIQYAEAENGQFKNYNLDFFRHEAIWVLLYSRG